MRRRTKDKEKCRRFAKLDKRLVLWKDEQGYWHAATDLNNTPGWAVEVELV